MKTNNKGQGMMVMTLVILIMLFVTTIVFILLDNVWKTQIFDLGVTLGANASVLNNLEIAWNAFPFVFAFCLFLVLIIHAITRG